MKRLIGLITLLSGGVYVYKMLKQNNMLGKWNLSSLSSLKSKFGLA